eukprot:gene8257-11173_t
MSTLAKRSASEEEEEENIVDVKPVKGDSNKKVKSANEEEIFSIGGRRKVGISLFKGKVFVNIREYYEDKNTGEEKPGSKGIALSVDQWNALTELIPDINKAGALDRRKNLTDYRNNKLLRLASTNQYKKIHDLVSKNDTKLDINHQDESGCTAVYLAATHGHSSIIELLVQLQADINQSNKIGMSPLHAACKSNFDNCVRLLIENGANAFAYDEYGRLPSDLTTEEEIFNFIKNIAIAPDSRFENEYMKGNRAFSFASSVATRGSICIDDINDHNISYYNLSSLNTYSVAGLGNDLATVTSRSSVTSSSTGRNNYTKFLHAVDSCDINTLKKILTSGIDESLLNVNVQDEMGNTPLHRLVHSSSVECVKLLISIGADVNISDKWGATPLHTCCVNKNEKIAELLISANAKTNAVDENGHTPSQVTDSAEMKLIIDSSGHLYKLLSLIVNVHHVKEDTKNTNSIHSLINQSLDIFNYLDENGCSILHLACRNNKLFILSLLLEYSEGKNIINNVDKEGSSAIYYAIKNNNISIINCLIMNQANLNIQDKNGEAPIHLAVKIHQLEILHILLENGCDMNLPDTNGCTAVYRAVQESNIILIQELISFKSNLNIKNKRGYTPLCEACYKGDETAVEVLIKAHADLNITNTVDKQPVDLLIKNQSLRALLQICHEEILGLLFRRVLYDFFRAQDSIPSRKSTSIVDLDPFSPHKFSTKNKAYLKAAGLAYSIQ